jgi:O-antigen/teichoic acid export membrane protein
MLVAIARLGNATMVGEFSLALSLVAPVLVVSQMQLRQVFVTDVSASVPFGAFFWVRAVSGALAVAGITAVVAVLGYDSRFVLVLVLLGIARYADSQSDIVYASLQRRERMHQIAASLMVRGVLGVVAVAAGMLLAGTLVAAVALLATVWVIAFVAVDLPLLRAGGRGDRLRWRWDARLARQLTRASVPLTIASGLVAFSAGVPRYFLDFFLGAPAVALFAVAMTPISLMGLFTGALTQTTLARAATYLQHGRLPAFESLARKLAWSNLALGLGLVALVVFAGRPLVRLLFSSAYDDAAPLMIVLAAGVAFSALAAFGSTVVHASRRFTVQLLTILAGLAVQLTACAVLVPRWGPWGAAWAELTKFVAGTICLHWMGMRAYSAIRARSAADTVAAAGDPATAVPTRAGLPPARLKGEW